MAAVTGKVEIEFTAGAWTDVTAYQLPGTISITVGRSDTDQRVSPGRMSGLRLDSTDGRFTVGNAAGAYYPNVASGKRVRISIKDPVSSSFIPRFVGRIDGWPLSWEDNGSTCVVTISATDMLGDWATAKMPASYLATRTAASPIVDANHILDAYFDCTSLAASGALTSVDGRFQLSDGGAAGGQFTTAGPPGDPRNCATFTTPADGSDTGFYAGGVPGPSGTGWSTWGVSVWVQCDKPDPSTAYYPLFFTQGSYGVAIQIWPDGYAHVLTYAGGAWNNRVYAPVTVTDGKWHLICIVCQPDGDDTYVSIGVDSGGGTGFGTGLSAAEVLGNADPRWLQLGRIKGAVGHFALWSLGYDAAPWAVNIYNEAFGLESASASQVVSDIAAMCGLPAPYTTGSRVLLGSSSGVTGTALDCARPAEITDNGLLWAQPDGTVAYLSGSRRCSGGTVLALTGDLIDPAMVVAADRLEIANHVELTNKTVSQLTERTASIVLDDAASIARHGRKDVALSTVALPGIDGLAYLAMRAGEELVTAEAPRIPTLPVNALTCSSAMQSALLAATVWDLVAVTSLPTAGGWDDRWLGRIEGWTESIGPAQWDITFNVSFAGNRLDDSTFGKLGTMRLS